MKLDEFIEQDKYCKENNTPEGIGCDKCPAKDKKHCSDALRNLCNKWLKAVKTNHYGEDDEKFEKIKKELDYVYGISPLNQLGLIDGIIEFSEREEKK